MIRALIRRLLGPDWMGRLRRARARLRGLLASGSPLFVPPGHFYSPIVAPDELERRLISWDAPGASPLPALDFAGPAQLELWRRFQGFLAEIPFTPEPQPGFRYHFANDAYAVGDGSVLYAMLRTFRPARVIEVGCGFSSACMLDTIERHLASQVHCTFIEPHPELLRRIARPEELQRCTVVAKPVQDVGLEVFQELSAGDILFIDSTHVLKTGSDVAYELLEILPALRAGVVIHIHDIFDRFEYPRSWVLDENRSWNELYALRAFLMYNDAFEILFFNDHFAKHYRLEIESSYPAFLHNPGGALWLRKTR